MNTSLQLYTPEMYVAEKELAFFLARLHRSKVKEIPSLTATLLHKQPEAVVNACTRALSIITGPPGTGKTTTLKMVVESFIQAGLRVLIVSPTGKAAKRANEVVNAGKSFVERVECATVHTGLRYDGGTGGFSYNRFCFLPYDVVVMDEFSMADCELMRDFIEAIQPGRTRVILCGDQYQLPSVGPGNIARDLMEVDAIPKVELDVVLRTGVNSGITYNANLILRGQQISKQDSIGNIFEDFFFVQKDSQEATVKALVKWITEDLPTKRKVHPIHDIQVMTPGKEGVVGRKNLNKVLRDALNPAQKNASGPYRVGDKLINLKNDKKLYLVNGDTGFVKEIVHGNNGWHVTVDFGPNTGPNLDGIVQFKGEMLQRLQMAFAQTVHKSQGSEFPIALFPVHRCHTRLLTRNLLYTGLTRGKSLAVLVGEYETVQSAIKNTISNRRRTSLSDELRRLLAA